MTSFAEVNPSPRTRLGAVYKLLDTHCPIVQAEDWACPRSPSKNPILNKPFSVPTRHYAFDSNGFPTGIEAGRRPSSYLVPIARPKKLGKGAATIVDDLPEEATVEQNAEINQIRARVSDWRDDGYKHVTPTTRMLLQFWHDDRRDRRLFFCQIEAVERARILAEFHRTTVDDLPENLIAVPPAAGACGGGRPSGQAIRECHCPGNSEAKTSDCIP